jgi:ankyrin repeat protein
MVFFLIKNGVAISSINLSDCNDVELIENLIKKGANRETIKIDKAFSDKEKLKQLIRLRGNMKNHKYIYFKKVFEDSEILDIFIENVDINTKYKTDDCPIIFKAVEYNDTIAVNKILKKGANLNLRCGKYSFNLLLFAVKEDNPEMLSFLLKKGLNANSKTNKNESALHLAVDTRNEKIINILIDAGAKLEYQGKYPSKTPLGYAVWKDEEIATKTLINRGANVNSTNKYGETPLIIAIEHQNLTIIKLLVENGANTKKAYKGKTPLRYAQSIRVSNEIIEYLKLH